MGNPFSVEQIADLNKKFKHESSQEKGKQLGKPAVFRQLRFSTRQS